MSEIPAVEIYEATQSSPTPNPNHVLLGRRLYPVEETKTEWATACEQRIRQLPDIHSIPHTETVYTLDESGRPILQGLRHGWYCHVPSAALPEGHPSRVYDVRSDAVPGADNFSQLNELAVGIWRARGIGNAVIRVALSM